MPHVDALDKGLQLYAQKEKLMRVIQALFWVPFLLRLSNRWLSLSPDVDRSGHQNRQCHGTGTWLEVGFSFIHPDRLPDFTSSMVLVRRRDVVVHRVFVVLHFLTA